MLTELLPCQNVKFSDSAWQAEMGGWWHTWYTIKKGFLKKNFDKSNIYTNLTC